MRPSRRAVLAGLGALAAGGAGAHTPYGQWVAYRKKHLLVGAHRGDPRTYDLAKAVVAALGRELPAARARVARGPRPERLASLIGTGQLMLAVIAEGEAIAMTISRAPFENYRPTPLTALARLDTTYGVYAAQGMPADHAWLVTGALSYDGIATAPPGTPIAPHPGAAAFWAGEAVPG